MNEAAEFASELDAVCTKYLKKGILNHYDYLLQIAFIYATLVHMSESDMSQDELIQLRNNAMGLIEDQIYGDDLTNIEEGTTH